MLYYFPANHLAKGVFMQSLDPRWLTVELEAIAKEDSQWSSALKVSYEAAVREVRATANEHQAVVSAPKQVPARA